MDAALEFLLIIIKKGGEFPEAVLKVVGKFKVSKDELIKRYDDYVDEKYNVKNDKKWGKVE